MKFLQNRFPNHSVEIIDYDSKIAHNNYIKRVFRSLKRFSLFYYIREYCVFKHSLKHLTLSRKRMVSDNLSKFKKLYENDYDLIIVGSDQVWMIDGMRGFPNAYWLPDFKTRYKCSYAASSRTEAITLKQKELDLVKKYINDFSYIGVRDNSTLKLLKDVTGNENVFFNPDPTFLWCFENEIENNIFTKKHFRLKTDKRTIAIMVSDKNVCAQISKLLINDFNVISLYDKNAKCFNKVLNPFEWASIIAHVDLVITNYFHPTCFSIKFNTQFISFDLNSNCLANSKIYDLLTRLELSDHYCEFQKTHLDSLIEKIRKLCVLKPDYSVQVDKLYRQGVVSIDKMFANITHD